MLKSAKQTITKFLPREHGATIIWLSSLVVALLSLREPPDLSRLLLFLASSVAILRTMSFLGRSSATIIRAERNSTLLPLMSCSLTLIAPLGSYLMANQVSVRDATVWLLLVTYTAVTVPLTQRTVRNIVFNEHKPVTPIGLGGTLLLALESLLFSSLGWINLAATLSVLPLLVSWTRDERIYRSSPNPEGSKLKRVKRIGRLGIGISLAHATILSVVSRL